MFVRMIVCDYCGEAANVESGYAHIMRNSLRALGWRTAQNDAVDLCPLCAEEKATVAQQAERRTCNADVAGSTPARGSNSRGSHV